MTFAPAAPALLFAAPSRVTTPSTPEPAAMPVAPPQPAQPVRTPMATVTLLADPNIDTERLLLESVDTSAGPLYSVSEMAKFFFARSSHWVRWLETCRHIDQRECSKCQGSGVQPSEPVDEPADSAEPAEPAEPKRCRTCKGEGQVDVKCELSPALHEMDASIGHHRLEGRLVLDGEIIEPLRTKSNARQYDLRLIERAAYALAQNQIIQPTQLRQALNLVRIQAEMHQYV